MVNRICSQQSVKIKSNTGKSVNTAMFYKCTSIHSKVWGENYFADGWRCGVRIVHLRFQCLFSFSIFCRQIIKRHTFQKESQELIISSSSFQRQNYFRVIHLSCSSDSPRDSATNNLFQSSYSFRPLLP